MGFTRACIVAPAGRPGGYRGIAEFCSHSLANHIMLSLCHHVPVKDTIPVISQTFSGKESKIWAQPLFGGSLRWAKSPIANL